MTRNSTREPSVCPGSWLCLLLRAQRPTDCSLHGLTSNRRLSRNEEIEKIIAEAETKKACGEPLGPLLVLPRRWGCPGIEEVSSVIW
jgi:hypothetical protein